jgi:hypothetical protein
MLGLINIEAHAESTKLDLLTLILMEKVSSAVSLSALFFWNQLTALSEGCLYWYISPIVNFLSCSNSRSKSLIFSIRYLSS